MAQYQKFMFDNFVISCEDDKCLAEPVEDIEPEVLDTEDTQPEPETIIEAEVSEVEEPPVATYTQEELDAAVTSAEERGYEKGFKAASGENEQRQAELLENINTRLMTLLAETSNRGQELEQDALRFALGLVKKLFPTLEKKQAEAEVQKFLKDNFPAFRREDSLSFSFNPAIVGSVAQSIGKLAEKNDFEGKIAVHKDDSLGLSECRIEWKNGGVEHSPARIFEKAGKLLGITNTNNEEREDGE